MLYVWYQKEAGSQSLKKLILHAYKHIVCRHSIGENRPVCLKHTQSRVHRNMCVLVAFSVVTLLIKTGTARSMHEQMRTERGAGHYACGHQFAVVFSAQKEIVSNYEQLNYVSIPIFSTPSRCAVMSWRNAVWGPARGYYSTRWQRCTTLNGSMFIVLIVVKAEWTEYYMITVYFN